MCIRDRPEGDPPGPNSLARQDHRSEEHSWGPQDRAQPPAHLCIDRRRTDSATASPALGKDALWASSRADPAQWIGRGRTRADPPCVNSPGPDNNSIATTNPAPAHRKYFCTSTIALRPEPGSQAVSHKLLHHQLQLRWNAPQHAPLTQHHQLHLRLGNHRVSTDKARGPWPTHTLLC